jgi:hypothetical protein
MDRLMEEAISAGFLGISEAPQFGMICLCIQKIHHETPRYLRATESETE